MQHPVQIYNTLSRKKEAFEPIHSPFVGLYLCGPTVYGHAHFGHARAAVTFDIVTRWLRHVGYTVRYVRNITDVGHLEHDADSGEDKIGKLARLQMQEPMEIAQLYANSYHTDLEKLGCLPPSIEPLASGHIPEQIKICQAILDKGLAYEVNGSVYFDVAKYAEGNHYGILSGRVIEDLVAGTRTLDGQDEKRSPLDFALWKKASPEHIMRWESPWGDGFPGWHIECTAMSSKYLGAEFDIHGGGMDLLFPHHECEIAQSVAATGHQPVRTWMHCNMLTINNQKMGKSLGNAINLREAFNGNNSFMEQGISPMTIRFFLLQAHYRSTVDLSTDAIHAARKNYLRLMNGLRIARKLEAVYTGEHTAFDEKAELELVAIAQGCQAAMNDDFNTAVLIAHLYNLLKKLNTWHINPAGLAGISPAVFEKTVSTYRLFVCDILGLKEEHPAEPDTLISGLLSVYSDAKAAKEYDKVDKIRTYFKSAGIQVKDMKTGIDWAYEE
ncbi:MAG: cysteine--tRNA ligase [Bacteroidota bacterium]